MHSLDHAGWFVSDVRSDALARQLRGIPHAVVLANDQDRITVLVPNYEVKRPQVKDRPFGSHLVLQRSKLWADRTENRFFTYKLHPSGAFLETSTLASSLYLLLLRLLHRDYELVTRVVASCATDVPFSRDEEWIFSMLAAGNDDRHPDAVATRLRMRLVSEESNAGWASTELPNPFPDEDIGKDYDMYVTKFVHVSASYRLDVDEEIALLRVIPPKFHPRNRAVYLRALQSIQEEQVRHAACVVALVGAFHSHDNGCVAAQARLRAKQAAEAPAGAPLARQPSTDGDGVAESKGGDGLPPMPPTLSRLPSTGGPPPPSLVLTHSTSYVPLSRTVQSAHPYEPGTDKYEVISFQGARRIVVTFDPTSCTSGDGDFVTFYKDERKEDFVGARKYVAASGIGGWLVQGRWLTRSL